MTTVTPTYIRKTLTTDWRAESALQSGLNLHNVTSALRSLERDGVAETDGAGRWRLSGLTTVGEVDHLDDDELLDRLQQLRDLHEQIVTAEQTTGLALPDVRRAVVSAGTSLKSVITHRARSIAEAEAKARIERRLGAA